MPDQGYLSIDFLDVGQGDGTFIVTPQFFTILVDLGSKKNADIAGGDAIKYLVKTVTFIQQQRGLQNPTIDILFLTHGDLDHYNLIDTLRAAFQPAQLEFNRVYIGGQKSEYGTLVPFLTSMQFRGVFSEFDDCQHNATDDPFWTFDSALWGNVEIYLLSVNVPNKTKSTAGAKNQKSIVLMIEYAERKVILTGDAESEMEGRVLGWYGSSPPFLECDALKLGHHGSQDGTTPEWLKALNPWCVFASSDQKWAHPYCFTLDKVITNGSLDLNVGEHPWLCGRGANASKQYFNHFGPVFGKYAIFTTLAFQKFAEKDSTLEEVEVMGEIQLVYDPDKVLEDGVVQGAQYQIRIQPHDGEFSILSTLYGSDKPVTIIKTRQKHPK